jgi:hypothetical protein
MILSANRRNLLSLVVLGTGLAVSGASASLAAGFSCSQDCSSGACAQAQCAPASQGQGFCACRSGAIPWSDSLYASWCSASGNQPICSTTPRGVAPRIAHGDALASSLQSRSPLVAALVTAMLDDQRWVDGPVEGVLHESRFNGVTGAGDHSQAVRFVAQVVSGALDAVQLNVTVLGDLGAMAELSHAMTSGSARPLVVPQSIQGTVTEGGLHGTLVVLGVNGQSETLDW